MKNLFILFTSTFVLYSCSSEPICQCFENRLEIKKMLSEADGDFTKLNEISESKKYKELKAKKKECQTKTEPEYFKNIDRKGRSDREFLLDELGDCDAVQELFNEK